MKKLVFTLLALIFIFGAALSEAKEWYEGGTLQKATIKKFMAAKPDNQLATAAEFIMGAMSEDALKSISSEQLKEAATDVVACMKNAPETFNNPSVKTAHAYAGLCQMALKSKYPWLVSIMD